MTSKERLYDEVRRIVVCYLHPDSRTSAQEAFNQIIRVVDTEEISVRASPVREVVGATHQ
jgi:hypothetical protein